MLMWIVKEMLNFVDDHEVAQFIYGLNEKFPNLGNFDGASTEKAGTL